ncbi:MAG: VanZ family protein [Janthinobacterium lividum]
MQNLLKYQRLALLWALFIFLICCVSLGKVGSSHLFFTGFDKLTHTGLFFVLTIFTFYGLIRKQKQIGFSLAVVLTVLVIMFLYGGAIELLQWQLFTYRSGDWNDLFCDILGSLMGIFSVLLTTYAISQTK